MFHRGKDVTRGGSHRPGKRISNVSKDRHTFSRTADVAHSANAPRRPMRGGIRL
nr:MAG: DNA binding protein [Microviridae sp.]